MSDSTSKGNHAKSFSKGKEGVKPGFKSPSRFSGNAGATSQFGARSQFKPIPFRVTQHKG